MLGRTMEFQEVQPAPTAASIWEVQGVPLAPTAASTSLERLEPVSMEMLPPHPLPKVSEEVRVRVTRRLGGASAPGLLTDEAPFCSDVSLALFLNGYLALVTDESVPVKEHLLTHL